MDGCTNYSHELHSDNADEGPALETDEGKKAIIALHVDGIIDFIQQRANEPL